jgi:O-acetyl-ADP-ribose deacetylase (regulator of RNase III)
MRKGGILMEKKVGGVLIRTHLGDITELGVDAIINAANSDLWMGGGVAGAIKAKGGKEIEQEAISLGPIKPGEAIMTTGGKLPARHVIHCAGMPPGGNATYWNVRSSVAAALDIACEKGLEEIAVPAIGAGIGGLSEEDSTKAIAESIAEYTRSARSVKRILLVGLNQDMCDLFDKAIEDAFIDQVMDDMMREDE